ncbi:MULTISPECIES: NAD(P)H:quinone oxidoreductase [Alteromonadaceae]|uniref:NAD(P)H:quinone oxidoreductase n=1 Tax=Alteromonadaceae TaxID=72275 RepID=UPI001C09807D|nr:MULTISPECIES: NAD(P)H:quinone oxidoreductase [unclassified Aliiglaciecola]MBU2877149.1 NAD(P)H:quinone oxidoreductase [Aliiglaciecola lipolytica]MDO6712079.1 NAD(P)H:quinone oxidoreductase [Aliiglaciecola sp. 2_MG-2023]MDO6753159.1 NAD(P)H:quinone oxidoreductase [Aliiglaciecola sp. 1_MG-2023]
MGPILVLYYSLHGATRNLANKIALGAQMQGADVIVRTVPKVATGIDFSQQAVPESGDPYVSLDELANCSGLALGSPTRFGNMSSAMKHFWDSTSSLWLSANLNGKPGCVFTSSSSMHGGQESTLLTMMIPLLHHGMLISGLPYSEPELHSTVTGGTPYGVTHVSLQNKSILSQDEQSLCIAQGKRLAMLAQKLGQK